jgi:preprotein translocase subunit YajC
MEQVLPILVIGALMYVALILPQQRRTKEHRALLSSLAEGDEVVLNSGIHGFVSAIDADVLWLEVADRVELKVARSAVASKLTTPTDDDEPEGAKGRKADDTAEAAQDGKDAKDS